MAINPKNMAKESLELNSNLKLFKIFKNLQHVSLKNDTYFQVYEEIFSKYIGKQITFVEIGVLHGGSLFMWKEYFGDKARIIGIDLNPKAKELEKHGFEIYIGSQSDKFFWNNFFSKVGKIDILLDDGGHSNAQQIITLDQAINNTNDNGVIVTEDVHTSYLKKFGNPSKFSFINYSKKLIDVINSRFSSVKIKKNHTFKNKIYSISFYESITAININSKKSINATVLKNNENESFKTHDLRNTDYFPKISKYIDNNLPILHRVPVVRKIIRYFFYSHNFFLKIKFYFILKKFFK
jgi:hypothetical protein